MDLPFFHSGWNKHDYRWMRNEFGNSSWEPHGAQILVLRWSKQRPQSKGIQAAASVNDFEALLIFCNRYIGFIENFELTLS